MSDLADGTYDVFVVDATEATLEDGTEVVRLELTVTSGEHKGEVVPLTATGLGRSEIDLMGMPATRTVDGGAPTITIDD
jgi:hypothetical protein